MRRIRSSSEMPHRSVNASGKSATINNAGRKGSVILGLTGFFRQFVQTRSSLLERLGMHLGVTPIQT